MNEVDARLECRNLKLVKPQTTQAFVRRPIDIQREILNGIKLVLMRVRRARRARGLSAPNKNIVEGNRVGFCSWRKD